MGLNSSNLPYSKESQLHRVRIKPTQRQKGAISNKVRNEVKERSGGTCEIQKKCTGSYGVHMAHLTTRGSIDHITAKEDLKHACIECHTWLDSKDGIPYRNKLRDGMKWEKD